MKCHCGRTALYRAGGKGFCAVHKAEASGAAIRHSLRAQSEQSVKEYLGYREAAGNLAKGGNCFKNWRRCKEGKE